MAAKRAAGMSPARRPKSGSRRLSRSLAMRQMLLPPPPPLMPAGRPRAFIHFCCRGGAGRIHPLALKRRAAAAAVGRPRGGAKKIARPALNMSLRAAFIASCAGPPANRRRRGRDTRARRLKEAGSSATGRGVSADKDGAFPLTNQPAARPKGGGFSAPLSLVRAALFLCVIQTALTRAGPVCGARTKARRRVAGPAPVARRPAIVTSALSAGDISHAPPAGRHATRRRRRRRPPDQTNKPAPDGGAERAGQVRGRSTN